mmetsp:Transcript_15702/g.21818  ORF Transcript_15702/g.21818 Transcript_15702/m.21818 type:complete len:199 (+) Transcript_15702:1190-1786(+)
MPTFDSFRESSTRLMNSAKTKMGMEIERQPSEDSDMLEDISEFCPKLSFQQRVIGFCCCFALGYLITFTSFSFFVQLMAGNPVPFVMVYSIGNILSLLSSMFLCGPQRQLKNMFDEKRHVTSKVYLSCLVASVILCFVPFGRYSMVKLFILVVLLLAQFSASIWYSLSYIPLGRRTVTRMLQSFMGEEDTSNPIGDNV